MQLVLNLLRTQGYSVRSIEQILFKVVMQLVFNVDSFVLLAMRNHEGHWYYIMVLLHESLLVD